MANQLPEKSIRRIQSFLNGEEAARTTILSKSWYGAWLTRPDLFFKQSLFRRRADEFREFTTKTIQRYEDLNLKIHALILSMSEDVSLANELVVRATELGVVDLDITVWNKWFVFSLRSETLATLSLVGSFLIDLTHTTCSKLKSLTLSLMDFKRDLFRDFISKFPLLETLKFDGLRLISRREAEFGDLGFRKLKVKLYTPNFQLQKLEYLYLGNLIVEGDLFTSASTFSKFPSLKELVISDCDGFKDIRICSESLERISVWVEEERSRYVTEFDVPNIRKFKFMGCGWSRLDLKTARSNCDWESDIHITCDYPNIEWFISLNELLKKLRGSKVSLSINIIVGETCDYRRSIGRDPHSVENLTLNGCTLDGNHTFLDNLFWICRPSLIIRDYYPSLDPVYEYLLELTGMEVVEKLNVELHPWKTVWDIHGWKFVHFRLRWELGPFLDE